ncbi:MAG: hypothetical protein EP330_17800 [Deltaproteobacteria bacterium]|nr:MAG: hypothetical protein EP330_17800 [Deltaproteobacteria bacterium]
MTRLLPLMFLLACGGNDADDLGVASECTTTEDCPVVDWVADSGDADETQLECLTQFAGGYCGLSPCTNGGDCPDGSICVAHTDNNNYCFRACDDKPECNVNRSTENEANCSANFDWADPADDNGERACIPPSSGV